MIPEHSSNPPTTPAAEAAAFELLDHLPELEGQENDGDWLPESLIQALLTFAEGLKLSQEDERREAPDLATQLERHPETRARMLIDNRPRFQTWGLAEELIERTRRSTFAAEPCRAVRIARLAVAVAGHLDPSRYGDSLAADLKARSWGNLGNAYRCAGQLKAAAAALERADEILLYGTGDPLEEAALKTYRASLETDSGYYDTAVELIEQACAIYRSIGETELLARALIQMIVPVGYKDPARAVALAEEAEQKLDRQAEPWLFLIARHNHIRCLIDTDSPERAAMLLEASRAHFRSAGNPWSEINLAWAEARLFSAFGELDEAEAAYGVLLDEMLSRGYQLEAALVALDLAACRLGQGRVREAAELAAAMAQTIREWGAHARARDAWALLQHALSVEKATVGLVREVSSYLQRCWRNPELPLPHPLRHQRELLDGA